MKTLTLSDIPRHSDETTLEIAPNLILRFKTETDLDHGAPWEEECGHGPVSDWTRRDKKSGERELCSDEHGRAKRFYDYAAAIKLAKKDGWDAKPYKTGTKGQQAVRAVEADFKHLQDWCNDRWCYIGVIVTLENEEGEEIESESLWGIESNGDYWRECALDMANVLLDGYAKERDEKSYWEMRDTVTV